MRKNRIIMLAVAAMALGTGASHGQGLTLNFGPSAGSFIMFGGVNHTFQFSNGTNAAVNPNGFQWNVTSEQGGTTSVGLFGSVTNGPFHYGPITGGAVQTAQCRRARWSFRIKRETT